MRGDARARGAIVGVALLVAGCSERAARPVPFDLTGDETGEQIYRRACGGCHGTDGRGHGPKAASLPVAPTDLTALADRNMGVFPHALVIDTITGVRQIAEHGTREMPVWRERFEPTGEGATAAASLYARRRTEALADYVATLQR